MHSVVWKIRYFNDKYTRFSGYDRSVCWINEYKHLVRHQHIIKTVKTFISCILELIKFSFLFSGSLTLRIKAVHQSTTNCGLVYLVYHPPPSLFYTLLLTDLKTAAFHFELSPSLSFPLFLLKHQHLWWVPLCSFFNHFCQFSANLKIIKSVKGSQRIDDWWTCKV